MRRFMFCVLAAIIAGTGLALALGLGVASFSAAAFKSQVDIETAVFERVQGMSAPVIVTGALGFVVGAGVIVWMFYGPNSDRSDPDDEGLDRRSEV